MSDMEREPTQPETDRGPSQQEQPPQGPPQQPQQQLGNGMAVAALVLGIVAVVMGLIPLTGFIAFICGAIGFILGAVGWKRARQPNRSGKGLAISGTILSAIGLVLGIWGMAVLFGAVDDFVADMDEIFEEDFEVPFDEDDNGVLEDVDLFEDEE